MGEEVPTGSVRIKFRWLGVAGIEIVTDEQILLIDPYLSRIGLWRVLFGRLRTNRTLIWSVIQRCDCVLVSHAHYDHLMDVPEVVKRTSALALGSKNSCQILKLHGVPAEFIREIGVGDRLVLGTFQVEVLQSEHIRVPGFASGSLAPDLWPPLRARDYRMDECFGFLITVGESRLLVRPGETTDEAAPADVLFVSPHRRPEYYEELLGIVGPQVVVPIHWDDFLRPVTRPLRPICKPPALGFAKPGRVNLNEFVRIVNRAAPQSMIILPELLRQYDLTIASTRQGGH